MRRLASCFGIVVGLGLVASLQAQGVAPTKPTLSYDNVTAAPEASVGKTVSWVVRFNGVLVDVGPDGAVTKVRTLFEYRDTGGAWTGRSLVAPPPQGFKWPEPPYVDRVPQTQPRLLSGTIAAVEQTTSADGTRILTPVLSDVTLEVLPAESVYTPGTVSGVSWPAVVFEQKPRYTPDGMRAKIQGSVELSITVRVDGTVGDVIITKSLDSRLGMDAAAVEAAKRWRFKPGLKDGKPVATRVGLVLEFRLPK